MASKKANGKRRLRSREWFDAPGDPTMASLYLERYMNFGLTLAELYTSSRPIIGMNGKSPYSSQPAPLRWVRLKPEMWLSRWS